MHTIRTVVLLLSLMTGPGLWAQTAQEKAHEKGMEAIRSMDGGRIEEALKLLEEAKKLDPANIDYPYETAYAHYLGKDYKKAIKVLEGLRKRKDAPDRVHQLLGNSYSMDKQRDKAIAAYEAGLKLFPNSGILYLERGNMEMMAKEYGKALEYYEKGIEVAPRFPSNYYWAAKIYLGSTEEVWGMMYGEIFMNLERNTKRTAEIGKLLFDTYKSEIQFTSDTSMSVSFSKNATIHVTDLSDPSKLKLPFGVGVYEPTLLMSLIEAKSIDLSSLDRIRRHFIDAYYRNGHDKTYPNVLFDHQRKIMAAGHLEAYNHWVLMMGDEDAFAKWRSEHKDEWGRFTEWFSENRLVLDENNRFHRGQY